MGSTDEVMAPGSFQQKFTAFGFDTVSIDGHDETALEDALNTLKQRKNGMPKAIIAKTVKGKGVSFMEHDNTWHYTRLNSTTFTQAMAELEQP
ncbi:transketolase [compost metagenome]